MLNTIKKVDHFAALQNIPLPPHSQSTMRLLNLSLLVFLKGFTGSVHAQIDLGTAASFSIVANVAVTNVGSTFIAGNLALYPNTETSILGFPPAESTLETQ